jgi:TRAP-type C4-dicarboxylate transport system permease small subunit
MISETQRIIRKPSIAMTVVRVALITVLATLLCFALALFLGIVGFGLANLAGGGSLNMTRAFKDVALPVGLAALLVSFVLALRGESRRYRRARADYAESKRAA